MRRTTQAISTLIMSGALLLASGCTQEQEAIIVSHAIVIPSDMCTADPGGITHLAAGAVDVSFPTGYTAAFAVKNNLNQTGTDGTNSGIEASEMKLTEAIVTLSMPGNANIIEGVNAMDASLVRYSQPLATDSFVGGSLLSPFVFIPASSLDAIRSQMDATGVQRAQMVMEVQFRALRSSNSSKSGVVESRSFELPIEVCNGCLRVCESTVTSAGDELCTPQACQQSGAAIGAGGVCGNAQDGGVNPVCCGGSETADSQALFCQ